MIAFIDDHRGAYGIEPICKVLPIAPTTYHAHVARRLDPAKLSERARRDLALKPEIARVFAENLEVYGARKVWRQLGREGISVARCTVERLMREIGLQGVVRGKPVRTTISDKAAPCPQDHVNRQFHAPAPNRLWLSDFTYVATWSGFVYVAFVIDAVVPRIVGWRDSRTGPCELRPRRAGAQALHERRPVHRGGLVHHSDRGSQYVSIKYTERLVEAGIEPSVGSVGDTYDNALAETINGLYKAELIHDEAHGAASRLSSSPRSTGSSGSITGAFSSQSATSRPPRPKPASSPPWPARRRWRHDRSARLPQGSPGARRRQGIHAARDADPP
jgi:putative transposase